MLYSLEHGLTGMLTLASSEDILAYTDSTHVWAQKQNQSGSQTSHREVHKDRLVTAESSNDRNLCLSPPTQIYIKYFTKVLLFQNIFNTDYTVIQV